MAPRILIDMQGVQNCFDSDDFYLLNFVKSLAKQATAVDLILVLSNRFVSSILPIREAFSDILPQEKILIWHSPNLPEFKSSNAENFLNMLGVMRESFFSTLNPDLILTTDVLWPSNITYTVSSELKKVPTLFVLDVLPNTGLMTPKEDIFLKKKIDSLTKAWRIFVHINYGDVAEVKKIGIKEGSLSLLENLDETPLTELTYSNHAAKVLEYATGLINSQLKENHPPSQIGSLGLPRLAYICPLPPLKSGIVDYSAQLIPYLSKYYQIDLVVDQADIAMDWLSENCKIRSYEWFLEEYENFDRVLYHFGNNPLHVNMINLLKVAPGTVVLHDFYLSGLQWYRERHEFIDAALLRSLYEGHGYTALNLLNKGDEFITFEYPCNQEILNSALGVIVHSENSLRLAKNWYQSKDCMSVVPLLREPSTLTKKSDARKKLGFGEDDFIVCSFGFLGKTKLNQRLLKAWGLSKILHENHSCRLVFVGEADNSEYCLELADEIARKKKFKGVSITGWTTAEEFNLYLSAADVGVQLRTLSRGETSAAVLDCLNFGLATIVNSNGSMADLPDDVVIKINDNFSDAELVEALESLLLDSLHLQKMQEIGRAHIQKAHNPSLCAHKYFEAIEKYHQLESGTWRALVRKIAPLINEQTSNNEMALIAKSISKNQLDRFRLKKIYFDISVVSRDDFKTGIQRVVRSLLLEMIKSPPLGYLVEPVYLFEDEFGVWEYHHAREYTLKMLDCQGGWIEDEAINPMAGDIFVGVDLAGSYVIRADEQGLYDSLRRRGVLTSFVVYDLIPIEFESVYPPGFKEGHVEWLRVVCRSDLAICISKSVASQLADWIKIDQGRKNASLKIDWFHLGADLEASSPSKGLPKNSIEVLSRISGVNSFLMVGTLEPRKGHLQTIKAFEILWNAGRDFILVVVGKRGWLVDTLIEYIRCHPELNKRLFWLESISDEYLDKVYAACTCLIAASEGEGFGLPLIEAAKHQIPIIARDIPVFREVGEHYVDYFSGKDPADISQAVALWTLNSSIKKSKNIKGMSWMTWSESSKKFSDILISGIAKR